MLLSVVIITKNEAHNIERTLRSIQAITDDIIIVDSGSTDDTIVICKKFNTVVIETNWDGFGENKNKGISAAKYDWILSLDADECIDEKLKRSLLEISLQNENEVFYVKRKNFFCNKYIRFGEWGKDNPVRIFNRNKAKWNNADVHEQLLFSAPVKWTKIKGSILHYTINNFEEYINKVNIYAKLNAKKYQRNGRKTSYFKLIISPLFTFVQHYFFRLGFLDGWEGYCIAKTTAWYTFLKYAYLKNLNKHQSVTS